MRSDAWLRTGRSLEEMQSIKGVLIDLGGVVYQGAAAIPGSVEAVERLRAAGIPFRFLTNTTSQPIAKILAKLALLGIEAARDDIFTPAIAARRYLTERGLQPFYLVSETLKADLRGVPQGAKPAVVVGDARDGFTYASLNEAFRQILAGAEFIALASNRLFVDDDGKPSLDVGAFVAALEYATGARATVLGKPARAFFRQAVADLGLKPREVAMIGDDAEFDAAAAIKAGLAGCVVHTGKWQPGDADRCEPKPTAEFDDLSAAVRAMIGDQHY
jgi:HAD superfamily hydrolase (TIGR01458 family)